MERFIDEDLWQCLQITEADDVANKLTSIIESEVEEGFVLTDKTLGDKISKAAKKIHDDFECTVPWTLRELKTIPPLKGSLSNLLMQHVFGYTEFVVDLNARKICVALDLIDWEEAGVEKKTAVKMVKITPAAVRRSILTWLPKGYGQEFHDVMATLGRFISADNRGKWGQCKSIISRNFSKEDRESLEEMWLAIVRFQKASRVRKKTVNEEAKNDDLDLGEETELDDDPPEEDTTQAGAPEEDTTEASTPEEDTTPEDATPEENPDEDTPPEENPDEEDSSNN